MKKTQKRKTKVVVDQNPEAVHQRMMDYKYEPKVEDATLCGEKIKIREIVSSRAWSDMNNLAWAKTGIPMPGGKVYKPSSVEARSIWALINGVILPGDKVLTLREATLILTHNDPKGAMRVTNRIFALAEDDVEDIEAEKKDGETETPEDGGTSSESVD